jgi:metal-sulfur cluster biosynthetic enzyme
MATTAVPLLAALATVRDPELDEPITSLGFVAACAISPDGEAEVRLRLPTYFCAPNFAYLMVADAYDAVTALPGVRTVHILLEDHFAAEAINGGVAAQAGFAQSFDGEAVGELDDLRRDFLRKAVLAGTDQVCRALRADGSHLASDDRLRGLTLGEVSPSRALARQQAEWSAPMPCRCICGGLASLPSTWRRTAASAVACSGIDTTPPARSSRLHASQTKARRSNEGCPAACVPPAARRRRGARAEDRRAARRHREGRWSRRLPY